MKVQSSARTQRTVRLDQGASGTEVHNMNHTTRPQRRLRHIVRRPAVARVASTILYELTHDREPGSYLRTRVRAVAPSTRTAYCA